MRHFRPTLENRVVLHASFEQLLAGRENAFARAAHLVLVVFAAGRQLVEAQATRARGGVGVLVDGGAGAGVLWALAGDWS